MRLKKWDAFDVITDDFALQGYIGNLGYVKNVSSIINFRLLNLRSSSLITRQESILQLQRFCSLIKSLTCQQLPTSFTTVHFFFSWIIALGTQDDIRFESDDFKYVVHNEDCSPTKTYQKREFKVYSAAEVETLYYLIKCLENQC